MNPIRKIRKKLGLTQAQCAETMSEIMGRPYHQSSWSRAEGKWRPSYIKPPTLAVMCLVLDVEPAKVLKLEEQAREALIASRR